VLTQHGSAYRLAQMFVRQIPKSGRTPDEVLRYLQLSAADIVQTAVHMQDAGSRRGKARTAAQGRERRKKL
jgi:hypothetical protein